MRRNRLKSKSRNPELRKTSNINERISFCHDVENKFDLNSKVLEMEKDSKLEIELEMVSDDPIKKLDIICCRKNCTVEYYLTKLKNKFFAKVTIRSNEERFYSTYPQSYKCEDEAKLAVARVALENEEKSINYPVAIDIEIKIYDLIKDLKNGFFSHKIPERFEDIYKEKLPKNWFAKIASNSELFAIDEILKDHYLLYPANIEPQLNPESPSESLQNVSLSMEELQVAIEPVRFDSVTSITLPWNLKNWNICITNPISTIEIWCQIIGPDYSDKFVELTNEMTNSTTIPNDIRPSEILIDHIYLAELISKRFYRVLIEQINVEKEEYYCFLFDFGIREWRKLDKLFYCDEKYLKLPPQAIKFSLSYLDELSENIYTKNVLKEINGKTFNAEIMSNKKRYDLDSVIRVDLYDLTDEYINYNIKILQQTLLSSKK